MTKVFINGGNGTTGLRIVERLSQRNDIELVSLPEAQRKDVHAQAELAAKADITFLCLPDEASQELIGLLGDSAGRVLDTSTAFRTDDRFAYGFPELSAAHAAAIRTANRVAVPGCHASGAIALLYPLITAGVIAPDAAISLISLTGYSGGGKKMIAEYETEGRDAGLSSPRPYALTQKHKHLPEIVHVCGLSEAPIFLPIVDDYYAGMVVSLPLHPKAMLKELGLAGISEVYASHYAGCKLIKVPDANPAAAIAANALAGSDGMQVFVTGSDDRMIACAQFDNLGKGASGAAIQCMNLMLGMEESTGLVL